MQLDKIVFIGQRKKLSNRILIQIIKDHKNEILFTIKNCKSKTEKRRIRNIIATQIYNTFINKFHGKFIFQSSRPTEAPKLQAINYIQSKMTNLIKKQQYRVRVLRGISFNDYALSKNKHKVLLDFLPLLKPDMYFDKDHNQYYFDNDQEIHAEYVSRIKNVDSRKFVRGNNHYVNGYCYSNPSKRDDYVFIVDYNELGMTDLHFKIAGSDESTRVRIRKLDSSHPLLKNSAVIKKLSNKVVNLGGNARTKHNTHVKGRHFMFSMCHHKGGKINDHASVPVRKWNSVEPKSLSSDTFGRLLESAISTEFPQLLHDIKKIEEDEDVNFIGDFAHSIDISVNLVNAAHFDMGDAGYGCGLWLSSDGKSNKNWYFVLPNASIGGSKGVAIKLDHGIMIEWNGKEIKHCSSDPGFDENQVLFGTFVGPKKKYSSHMRNCTEEPIIPEDFIKVVNEFNKIFK